jgi:hypothetical protein
MDFHKTENRFILSSLLRGWISLHISRRNATLFDRYMVIDMLDQVNAKDHEAMIEATRDILEKSI